MTSTRLASSGFSETRVWVECLVSRALKTWSRSLLFKDIRIFAYSSTREQSNKTSGTRLKTESETAKRLKWCPRTFRVTLFSLFGEHQGIIYPPPAPPTIKHATGVTDNKKYSSRDHESLAIDPGGHHQNTGSYREVPPKRGTFFRPRAYQRIKISLVEVFERVEKSVTSVCKKSQKRPTDAFYGCVKVKKTF